jgi:hypothetical protein
MLDTEELLHLAAHAGASGNPHAALLYLNELLEREPCHAKALHLRGAQHAQIGLFERGIAGMTSALDIEPELEFARFQLGVLLFDRNRGAEAKQHLRLLHSSADRALKLHSQALVALIDGDRVAAVEKVEQGLAVEFGNTALTAMMRRLHATLAPASRSNAELGTDVAVAFDGPINLGAYRHEGRQTIT